MADEVGLVDVETQGAEPTTEGDLPADTTGSEPGQQEPEPTEGAEPPQEKKKESGIQKRIDELTREKHEEREARFRAEARAEAYEEILKGRKDAAPTGTDAKAPPVALPMPQIDQFDTQEEYSDALRAWVKSEVAQEVLQLMPKLSAQTAEQRERQETVNRRVKAVQDAEAELPALRDILRTPEIYQLFTPVMEEAADGPNLPRILEHLGTHLPELRRINALPPVQQVKEIMNIEARLSAKPPKKTESKAPEPTESIKTGKSAKPKSPEEMSVAELDAHLEKLRRLALGVKT